MVDKLAKSQFFMARLINHGIWRRCNQILLLGSQECKIYPIIYWLVVEPPLWKIWKSVGIMTFPKDGNSLIKHVPNHQPVYHMKLVTPSKLIDMVWTYATNTEHHHHIPRYPQVSFVAAFPATLEIWMLSASQRAVSKIGKHNPMVDHFPH